jgi:uncharacterized protein (DUF983 family)
MLEGPRATWPALVKGFAKTCPSCGRGRMFGKYLKVNAECPQCGTELHHHRADDAPPYFTIMVVGHIIVPGMLLLEQLAEPASWVHTVLWVPLTLVLSLLLLPKIKGALVGFQWAHRMHGFGGAVD